MMFAIKVVKIGSEKIILLSGSKSTEHIVSLGFGMLSTKAGKSWNNAIEDL